MNRESTMRAGESMSVPITGEATSRTVLRCVPGIDLSGGTFSLDLVADHIKDHTMRQTENRLSQDLLPRFP